jgi:hypothetical protein
MVMPLVFASFESLGENKAIMSIVTENVVTHILFEYLFPVVFFSFQYIWGV